MIIWIAVELMKSEPTVVSMWVLLVHGSVLRNLCSILNLQYPSLLPSIQPVIKDSFVTYDVPGTLDSGVER